MGEFWDYSLEIYGRSRVADTCLALQDRVGLDVNLLLFCLWAGSRGHLIEPAEMAQAVAISADWQRDVVGAFRALRRGLKHLPGSAGDETERLRDLAKRRELDAEAVEQGWLESRLPLTAIGVPDTAKMAANLTLYAEIREVAKKPDVASLLASLLGAAIGGPTGGADGPSD